MVQHGVSFDKYSLSLVLILKACTRVGLLKEGMQIHALSRKLEIGSELYMQNCLISLYMRNRQVESARRVFDTIPRRDSVSHNLMIDGYANCGMVGLARDIFDRMPEADKNLISWNSMIKGYVQFPDGVEVACQLFEAMPERDLVLWNLVIDGYAKQGRMDAARDLFDQMTIKEMTSWATMIDGYAKSGDINIARDAKCGSIDDAFDVFKSLEENTVDHWNATICGFAIHGMGIEAFELLMEMERIHLNPDEITFIGVLNAYGHNGLIKEGLICFDWMRFVHRLEPKLQHYGCTVDILGRAGKIIQQARRFIDELPIEPNSIVWRILLGHCKNHGDLSLGESVAEHLISLDSSSPGTYILLSNIYAGCGMWDGKKKVRARSSVTLTRVGLYFELNH